MKKLLLFSTLLTAFGFGANAQNTNVAISAFNQPTGTVYIDGNGNGSPVNTIEVTLVNNDANQTFAAGSVYYFGVTLDGNAVTDPNPAGNWDIASQNPLAPGSTIAMTIATNWTVSGDKGSRELCVSLNQIFSGGLYMNEDANKELCETFEFAFPVSVEGVDFTEISQVVQLNDMLQVRVKSNESTSQVQLINLTGQVVRNINSTSNGQNFYADINVADLAPGIYVVNVISESGNASAQKVYIK